MRIPIKITPCPIVETIYEVRFIPSMDPEAVFPILYSLYSQEFPNIEKQPILEIPQRIRDGDENLRNAPIYKLNPEKGSHLYRQGINLSIGPRVFSINQTGEYSGWNELSKILRNILDKLTESLVIDRITRAGMRYINLFQDINIYEKSTLSVEMKDRDISINMKKLNTSTELDLPNGIAKISVLHPANYSNKSGNIIGSIIDIDVIKFIESKEDLLSVFTTSHTEEKNIFFSLLKDDYISTLKPEY